MSERFDNYGSGQQRRLWPYAVALALIAAVVAFALISGGSDDPDPIAEVLPTSEVVEKAKQESGYNTQEALPDGAATAPGKGDPGKGDADPLAGTPGHPDEPGWKSVGGDAAGSALTTAEKFATLQINRPTDAEGSGETDDQLAELSVGLLSHQIASSNVMTSQIASTGEVIRMLVLEDDGENVKVLVTTHEKLPDGQGATGGERYLNYIVHLRNIDDGRFGVTSWEPQI